jgi:hypothetical protein
MDGISLVSGSVGAEHEQFAGPHHFIYQIDSDHIVRRFALKGTRRVQSLPRKQKIPAKCRGSGTV